MYCIKCGKELLETDMFCGSCGTQKNANTNNQNTSQQADLMNPGLSDVERARIYSSYTRKIWFSALGPFVSLFLIVTLWGLVALLGEISDSTSTFTDFIGLIIPILIALSVLAIPIGIVMVIIYARNRSQFKPIIK